MIVDEVRDGDEAIAFNYAPIIMQNGVIMGGRHLNAPNASMRILNLRGVGGLLAP